MSHYGILTHCVRGHEYDERNTYVNPRGQRQCRACARVRSKASHEARRNHKLASIDTSLPCSLCDANARYAGEYVCRSCAAGNQMFNHCRPAVMQGSAVPIFAAWPTKVRER
jgi:hypothetical protein